MCSRPILSMLSLQLRPCREFLCSSTIKCRRGQPTGLPLDGVVDLVQCRSACAAVDVDGYMLANTDVWQVPSHAACPVALKTLKFRVVVDSSSTC